MLTTQSYRDYVTNAEHMKEYAQYQKRYATQLRESDKVLIDYVRQVFDTDRDGNECPSLLDIGCSTGNFLLHLKRLLPNVSLTGGDMAAEVLATCKSNPDLQGIEFVEMDATDIPGDRKFDLVVANAILGALDEMSFDKALSEFARVLQPGGWLFAFDWFHQFEQQLTITEVSKSFPNGFTWRARGYGRVAQTLRDCGFSDPEFIPFYIPIDLAMLPDSSSIQTHTVSLKDNRRLSFRGAFCQPWCHLAVRKLK